MHLTYYTISAGGNFRLTARVATFNGAAGSQVGLTVRQGTSATAAMGAVAFQPSLGSGTSPNLFSDFARDNDTGALYPWKDWSYFSAGAAPTWLQLTRYGNNFSIARSSDGIFWAPVSWSGGAFSVTGAIQVGFYVSSGGTGSATATIDNVNLDTNPILAYESSWIGNTFSSDFDGYVSNNTTAMWVGADGTCYASSYYDEGGQCIKKYKNGKVTGYSYASIFSEEGSITGDGTHMYTLEQLGGADQELFQSDLNFSTGSMIPMLTQTPLFNGQYMVSGMACGNGELYVSDPQTQQILVLNPSQTSFGAPPWDVVTQVANTIDTSAVTNPAPQAVYQTAFQGLIQQTIPGLTVGQTYTVRLHFAELTPTDGAVGKRLMDIFFNFGQVAAAYDIYAATGSLYKASVLSFTGVAPDSNGNLNILIEKDPNTVDGNSLLNGIEVYNSDGSVFAQVNCGGSTAGAWQTSIQEIPGRDFAFTRPGPIAIDKNGNLWIVQEGTPFPAVGNFHPTAGWAAIKLYDKNGNYLNKQITDVVSPTALYYNTTQDQLLVAENGPAQNIRTYNVYTGMTTAPVLASTFGVSGGVFSGATPGAVYDVNSGGNARFFGLTGVGMDSSGNLYVACSPGGAGTDIKAFNAGGTMLWDLSGLEFCNVGDFDPTAAASDLWTVDHHYTMNYSGSTAGGEAKLKSYTTNPFSSYSFPTDLANRSAVYRKVQGSPLLFSAQQGYPGTIYIFRFVGEQEIPCGSILDPGGPAITIWIDSNGDGIEEANEVFSAAKADPATALVSFDVDISGNIFLAMTGTYASNPNVQEFAFQGFNSNGVPIYPATSTSVTCPASFKSLWGISSLARLRYVQGSLDSMYLLCPTNPNAGSSDLNYGATLACFDHWSTAPTQRFQTVLPNPANSPNFADGAPPYTDGVGFSYSSFDVANGYAFATELWGTVHVVDFSGKLLPNIIEGPEVSGLMAWDDEYMGTRVHYNPALGEYDIALEQGGEHAHQMFYRWTPGPFLTSLDIGSVGKAGSSGNSQAGNTYTVNGGGADIWGTTDAFQFDYQALAGDCTIVARVTSVTNTNVWAKAGIMIRETLTTGSREASMLMTPTTTDGGTWQWRTATNGSSSNTDKSRIAPTYWVKLVRSGNVFTGYVSPDGSTWTKVGSSETISMASSVYVGLAVTSHDNTKLCTGTFDHVKITSP